MMRAKSFYVISSLVIAVSCAATSERSDSVRIDSKRVLSYTFELEKLKPLKSPFVAEFQKKNKTLLFIASKHLSILEYPNLQDHPTLKTIKKLFQDAKPGVVIVEGINTGNELSPKSILPFAERCKAFGYKGCGESIFAINAAREANSEYITGEPRDAEILQRLREFGYQTEDLMGFYMIREIPQLKRQGHFDGKNFEAILEKHLSNIRTQLGFSGKFGPDEFAVWYAKNMRAPKDFRDIGNADAAPHGGKNASYVQKISNRVTWLRDVRIVETIENMLNRFDVVLVVYGGSHLITQQPTLIESLGQPRYFKIF